MTKLPTDVEEVLEKFIIEYEWLFERYPDSSLDEGLRVLLDRVWNLGYDRCDRDCRG